MIYNEVYQDLFTVDKKYALGHCVAQDGIMGAGIAPVFCKLFGNELRDVMRNADTNISDVVYFYSEKEQRHIYNIITKKSSYGKPTRKTFNDAIYILRDTMIENKHKHLAIPLIGSGLDRLSWSENVKTIKKVFADTDIEILVCKIK